MLKIVQAPNTVLSQQAKSVTKIDKSILHLIKEMTETLDNAKDPEGVGLAAPQVGKSLQIFLVRETPRSQLSIFINPVIDEVFEAPPQVEQEEKEKEEKKGVQ